MSKENIIYALSILVLKFILIMVGSFMAMFGLDVLGHIVFGWKMLNLTEFIEASAASALIVLGIVLVISTVNAEA